MKKKTIDEEIDIKRNTDVPITILEFDYLSENK